MGARNQVGTECGIASPNAHKNETSVLEAGIDFSFLSLSF
jgi:hypothetical protein